MFVWTQRGLTSKRAEVKPANVLYESTEGSVVKLADFVALIEEITGRKSNLESAPKIDADVERTFADISKARKLLDYSPQTSVKEGIENFWAWYKTSVLEKSEV